MPQPGAQNKPKAAPTMPLGFTTPMATSNSQMLGQTTPMPLSAGAPAGGWNPSAQPWVPAAATVQREHPSEVKKVEPVKTSSPESPLRNFARDLTQMPTLRAPSPVRPPSPINGRGSPRPQPQPKATIVSSLLPASLGASQPMDDAGASVNLAALLQMVRQPKSIDQ